MLKNRFGLSIKITLLAVIPVVLVGTLVLAIVALFRASTLSVVSQNLASTVTRVLASSLDVSDFSLVESQLKAAVAARDVAFVDVRPPNATMRFFVSKTPNTDWSFSRDFDKFVEKNPTATQFIYTNQLKKLYQQQLEQLDKTVPDFAQVRQHLEDSIQAFAADEQKRTSFEVVRAEVYDLPNGQRHLRLAGEAKPLGVKAFDLGVAVLAQDIQNVLDRQFFWMLFIIVLALLAALVGAIIVSQRLSKPILEITRAANRISLGEIHTPIATQKNPKDEVDDLRHAVDRMRLSLVLALKRSEAKR